MLKKLSAALVLAGIASSPAFALSNTGFETGTNAGWTQLTGATLTAKGANTSVTILDEADPTFSYTTSINPISGSYFGLLTGAPTTTTSTTPVLTQDFTLNLSGGNSTNGDMFWMRLLTADYYYAPSGYNDSIKVTFNGTGATKSYTIDALSLGSGCATNSAPCGPDSGWKGFALPTGTQNITLTLANYGDTYGQNAPVVALDFQPAAAVPEPDAMLMMLAGLGALGFTARRRKAK